MTLHQSNVTIQTKMTDYLITIVLLLFISVQSNGQYATYRVYKELNCTLNANGQYDCGFQNMRDDKCYYKRKEFSVGETLPDSEGGACTTSCECVRLNPSKPANWNCVTLECPHEDPKKPNCKYLYEHGKCCSTEQCPSENSSDKNKATCEYNGKSYSLGEEIETDLCKKCICQEGFNGKLVEPWCKDYECDISMFYLDQIRKGCSPIHLKSTSCCPTYNWRCPLDSDIKIAPSNLSDYASINGTCSFGQHELSIGLMVSTFKTEDGKCADCTCYVPPMLTCVEIECAACN